MKQGYFTFHLLSHFLPIQANIYLSALRLISSLFSAVAKSYFLKVASEQNSVMGAPTTGGDGGVKIPSWLPSLYGG